MTGRIFGRFRPSLDVTSTARYGINSDELNRCRSYDLREMCLAHLQRGNNLFLFEKLADPNADIIVVREMPMVPNAQGLQVETFIVPRASELRMHGAMSRVAEIDVVDLVAAADIHPSWHVGYQFDLRPDGGGSADFARLATGLDGDVIAFAKIDCDDGMLMMLLRASRGRDAIQVAPVGHNNNPHADILLPLQSAGRAVVRLSRQLRDKLPTGEPLSEPPSVPQRMARVVSLREFALAAMATVVPREPLR